MIITKVRETCSIPPDVVFQIEERGHIYEVKAHKFVLAMISPVFEKMFYTTQLGDKTAQQIKIEQTTKPAFQIIIEAVYNSKSIPDSLNGKSIPEIFDLVNLIERYEIAKLAEVISKYLSSYPITDDTVLEVAEEVLEFTSLFPSQAHQLLLCCAKFLQPKFKDIKSIYQYMEGLDSDKKFVFANLQAKMNCLIECSNCKSVKCKNGEGVKEEEFRIGLLVRGNMAPGWNDREYWSGIDYGIGRVTVMNGYQVKVATVQKGAISEGFDDEEEPSEKGFGDLDFFHDKEYCMIPLFLFSCE